MKLRLGEAFNTQLFWSRSDVHLPGGDFLANLVRIRVPYSFSPRMNLQALVQYNNAVNLVDQPALFAAPGRQHRTLDRL